MGPPVPSYSLRLPSLFDSHSLTHQFIKCGFSCHGGDKVFLGLRSWLDRRKRNQLRVKRGEGCNCPLWAHLFVFLMFYVPASMRQAVKPATEMERVLLHLFYVALCLI